MSTEASETYGESPMAAMYREWYLIEYFRHIQRKYAIRSVYYTPCQADCFFCRRDAEAKPLEGK